MNLTEDQILSLAPDDSSKKAGKDLANPSKWVTKGISDQALWGECQGSGSKPYQTQIDTANIAFKCSCPSRKFPCKHGLGLLLHHSRQPDAFSRTAEPAWVTEWLGKRADTQQKKATREDKPVDEAAQQKRQQARQRKVADGIAELRLWLKDIVRNGILNIPSKGASWFDNMAKRMVDAQAGGLAGMVRGLGETNFYADGWQSEFMARLVNIYLVIEGYTNGDSLHEALQQDLRTLIGFPQNQDELRAQAGITDTWLVIAKQTIDTDNITTERNWLYGMNSGRYALVLQFIIRGQGAELSLTPGLNLEAELVFFPSASPLRAIVKSQSASGRTGKPEGLESWLKVAEAETASAAALPVRSERPFVVKALKPVQYNNSWWLQDETRHMMQLKNRYNTFWKLLSLSGGQAMDMVVIGKEDQYETVAVWHNNEFTIL
ncbi:SWIM zinc finger family protein [Chitinophaga barathri]|uniref:SWIM zinc finger family protein n=1 Tax=Chitinophaga barathri TaxID=1647451 RepID=A0A3N4M6N0_9BACT|nr:SWIM zinc finger family protein [Chitinophaga barathri]RPD38992.1 SWIM zinc finger family protein [Chitinophaga barathri]